MTNHSLEHCKHSDNIFIMQAMSGYFYLIGRFNLIRPQANGFFRIFAKDKTLHMIATLINIISASGTLMVICSLTMLILQGVCFLFTADDQYKKYADYIIIIIGIVVALALIPFYYLPS